MYYSARTFVGADTAAAALGIIDRGDVIAYAYRLLRTVFLTYAAAYAADITVFSSGLAVVDRHAADPLPAVERDQADYMLWTGGYADTASAAFAVIDRRNAVTHGYRVKGAVLRAGAEPDAAVRAELISSAEL